MRCGSQPTCESGSDLSGFPQKCDLSLRETPFPFVSSRLLAADSFSKATQVVAQERWPFKKSACGGISRTRRKEDIERGRGIITCPWLLVTDLLLSPLTPYLINISLKTADSRVWLPETIPGCLILSAAHVLRPLISDGATPTSIS